MNDIAKRVEELMAKMTVAEKVGQLNQCGNSIYNEDYKVGMEWLKKGLIGSLLGETDVETINELQRIAVEETRLGIPLLFGYDVIHGLVTAFPVPWTEAFSWEPELARKTSEASAKEAAARGINWVYAPMVDIARDARWGRGVEGSGEDTLLGCDFARARVKGTQGDNLADGEHAAACVKHFLAYGAAISGRDYNTVDISEQSLREVYLPPFKAAVDAGCETVMTAFHDLNGEPCTGSYDLLTGLLKKEMGFGGVVISDAGSTDQIKTHGFAADYREVAKTAINAGLDVEMCFGQFTFVDNLEDLVGKGEVSMETLDEAVRRVLTLKFKLGLFENPYKDVQKSIDAIRTDESIALAYEAAVKSLVLVKNDNKTLPLKEGMSVCMTGPFAADKKEPHGTWIMIAREEDNVTPLEGVEKYANVTHIKGCNFTNDTETDLAPLEKAAKETDTVLVFIGEPKDMNGEGRSRTSNTIPGDQLALLKKAREFFKTVVSVVVAGRPVVLTEVMQNSDAVIFSGALGNEAGNAYADILFGKKVPSGKLVNTFPTVTGQAPLYYNENNTGKPPVEEFWWTSKFIDAPIKPLLPFGFGLSYAEFEYSDITLNNEKFSKDDEVCVDVTIKNTGDYDGEEIVQMYVTDVAATRTRPVKELKAYKKVFIKKGEEVKVTLKAKVADFGFYDKKLNYVVESGKFIISAGKNSADVISKEIEVI